MRQQSVKDMKKKTFWEIIDTCEKKDSPSDVLHSLQTREMLYETDKNGKTIKKYLYRLSGGRTVTETCTRLPYRDVSKLNLPALQGYLEEIEACYEEIEELEPEDSDSAAYGSWEDDFDEAEEELDNIRSEIQKHTAAPL